jgi:PAS domain S-box-containing protein
MYKMHGKETEEEMRRTIVIQIVILLAAVLVSSVIIWRSEQNRLQIERARIADLAGDHAHALQATIERSLSATYALAALVRQGKGTIPDFETTAAEMLPFYPGASSLQLAPGGVVRQIVPLTGNEGAIGHNLLKDPARTKEAFLALDTGKLTLAGPFNLVQGGIGAVGRLPVFINDAKGGRSFWGFTIVLIRFPEALNTAQLPQLEKRGFRYELWRIHPDSGKRQVIAASSTVPLVKPVDRPLTVPNGTWTLSVTPIHGWSDPWGLTLKGATGTLFSLLLFFLTRSLLNTRAAARQIAERLTSKLFAQEREFRSLAEEERTAHLRFLESMDRINRALQGTTNLEQMMSDVLDVVLSIFHCDRAFLLYPCDPVAESCTAPMERTAPGYPGVPALGLIMPMDPDDAETLGLLLASDDPVKFGPGTPNPLPKKMSERFSIKSLLSMALYPKVGRPWQFGMHQCSCPRVWTTDEERLFLEIGRRLEDGLTSFLTYRDLQESEERYRRIVDTATEGILVLGPDTMTTFANSRMAEILGYSCEEMIGRPLTDFMFEEDLHDLLQKLDNRRRGFSETYERRFRRKDGQTVWTQASATPTFDAEHHFNGSFGMFTDITGRKLAERAVEESRNFLDKIINSITDPILVKDRQHCWVLLNDSYCNFMGYSRDELLGKSDHDFFPKKDADVFWSKDEIVFTSGMENINEEEFSDETGVVHTISTKRTLYTDEVGEKFIVGILRDITENKRVETRLNEQLHFLQQLLDSIPIPVYYKDVDGLYLGCNTAFETFIGLPRRDIVGKTVYEVVPKERADKHHEADSALLCQPGEQIYQVSGTYKDGEYHDVIFNKATFLDANDRVAGIVGAMMDITSLRKAEEERKLLEAQLYQAQKLEAIGQLAGGIAHDFNNILTTIIGYAEIIRLRMEKDSPLRHFIEQVLASADRAAELTNGLLAFSRRQILHTKPVDLCGVVRDFKKMLGRLLPEDIDFMTTVAEGGLIVMADKGQIEQVLMNLVTNAKDAMPRGGTLSIEVFPAVIDERFVHAHGFGEQGNYACVSVTDTGYGMDEETRKRIFEPFFTTKEVGKGTGLGMAIVYGIIQQHNGCVTVSSETGKGTTFRIYLQIITEEVKEVQGARVEKAPPGGTETVLLVEDEDTVRDLYHVILEEAGYKVIEATDGEDALGKFLRHMAEVDIVVTDVVMPKIDGKILYEEIRKIRPDMKVLFMSGYTKDIIVERGILDDEFSYISKPVKSFELLKSVREILDR